MMDPLILQHLHSEQQPTARDLFAKCPSKVAPYPAHHIAGLPWHHSLQPENYAAKTNLSMVSKALPSSLSAFTMLPSPAALSSSLPSPSTSLLPDHPYGSPAGNLLPWFFNNLPASSAPPAMVVPAPPSYPPVMPHLDSFTLAAMSWLEQVQRQQLTALYCQQQMLQQSASLPDSSWAVRHAEELAARMAAQSTLMPDEKNTKCSPELKQKNVRDDIYINHPSDVKILLAESSTPSDQTVKSPGKPPADKFTPLPSSEDEDAQPPTSPSKPGHCFQLEEVSSPSETPFNISSLLHQSSATFHPTFLETSTSSVASGSDVCVDDNESLPTLAVKSAEKHRLPADDKMHHNNSSSASTTSNASPTSPKRRKSGFQSGITVGYTYDAFFMTDGRSKKKKSSSGIPTLGSSRLRPAHSTRTSPVREKKVSDVKAIRSPIHVKIEPEPTTSDSIVTLPSPSAVLSLVVPSSKQQQIPFASPSSDSKAAISTLTTDNQSVPPLSPSSGHLFRHKQQKQRYTCSECGKDYATSSNLSRHKQTHRSLDSQAAKKCPHCPKVYVSMPALAMHILTHDLKHRCHVCGKAFSRPWLLHGHLRAHSGEKPYGCAHCGRAFADRSNLRAHMQTHSMSKSFVCDHCGKSFALKSYLNKHIESSCGAPGHLSKAQAAHPGNNDTDLPEEGEILQWESLEPAKEETKNELSSSVENHQQTKIEMCN